MIRFLFIDTSTNPVNDYTSLEEISAALYGLRTFLNDGDATFKSITQAEAMVAVKARKNNILVVLPCGGGKTAAYAVPIMLEQGLVSVLVVPLVALQSDLCRRLEEASIRYEIYHVGRMQGGTMPDTKIIVVPVENAVTPPFIELCQRLVEQNKLARVVSLIYIFELYSI